MSIPAPSAGTDRQPAATGAKSAPGWQKLAEGFELAFLIPLSMLKSVIPKSGS